VYVESYLEKYKSVYQSFVLLPIESLERLSHPLFDFALTLAEGVEVALQMQDESPNSFRFEPGHELKPLASHRIDSSFADLWDRGSGEYLHEFPEGVQWKDILANEFIFRAANAGIFVSLVYVLLEEIDRKVDSIHNLQLRLQHLMETWDGEAYLNDLDYWIEQKMILALQNYKDYIVQREHATEMNRLYGRIEELAQQV